MNFIFAQRPKISNRGGNRANPDFRDKFRLTVSPPMKTKQGYANRRIGFSIVIPSSVMDALELKNTSKVEVGFDLDAAAPDGGFIACIRTSQSGEGWSVTRPTYPDGQPKTMNGYVRIPLLDGMEHFKVGQVLISGKPRVENGQAVFACSPYKQPAR